MTDAPRLRLTRLDARFAVCRLPPDAAVPSWARADAGLLSITRTRNELSLVCAESLVPDGVTAERGFMGLVLDGPIAFTTTGVIAAIAGPLARAALGVFVVSTYDTDYVLVKQAQLDAAIAVLGEAGHTIVATQVSERDAPPA